MLLSRLLFVLKLLALPLLLAAQCPSPSPAEETLAGIATGASSFSSGALGTPLGQRPSPAGAPNASASGAALNAMTLRAFGGGSEMSTKAAMEAAARATRTRSRTTEVTRSFPKTSTGALPPFPASVGDWVEDPDATARRARLMRQRAPRAADETARTVQLMGRRVPHGCWAGACPARLMSQCAPRI